MMRVLIKQSDESRNTTTTLADDGELTVALEASTTYFIDINFTFDAAAATDFKYVYLYTGTISNALTIESAKNVALVSSGSGDARAPCYNLGGANFTTPTLRIPSGNDTVGTVGGGFLRGVLITNSAGNLKLQWAQNVSGGANVTVHKGSYIALAKQADMDGGLIVKAADTSRASNTALSADPDLQFATKANSKYICEVFAVDYSTSTAPDYQCALHDAQVAQCAGDMNTLISNATGVFGAGTETAQHGQFWTAGFLTTPTMGGGLTNGIANKSHRHVHWSQVQGASSGTLAFEWAQTNSSATPTIVVAPSWILYEEIFQDTVLVPPLAGTAALSFAPTGTLTSPPGAAGGLATLAFAATATGTRTGVLSGTGTLSFDATATFTSAAALAGTVALTFSASAATAASGAMSGATTLAFTLAASASAGAILAGTGALSFTAAATSSAQASLSGSAALAFAPAATVSGGASVGGTAALALTAAAAVSAAGSLSGSAALAFAPTATITGTGGAAAACTFRTGVADTAATPKTTGTFTPAVGDLLVVLFTASNTANNSWTVSSSIGGFTFSQRAVVAGTLAGDRMFVYTADALVSSATSQTVTVTNVADQANGSIIFVYSVSGMTKTGAAAVRQSKTIGNQAAATPALTFDAACLTANPTLAFVYNSGGAPIITPPSGWTEPTGGDLSYLSPLAGAEVAHRDSGFTGTTVTWGSASATSWGAIIVELDSSP